MIVLVTSSRDWPRNKLHIVWAALNHELLISYSAGEAMELVHGDCATGGDAHAHDWYGHMRIGKYRQVVSERLFPARWEAPCTARCKPNHRKSMLVKGMGWISGCPSQGPIRNSDMVAYATASTQGGGKAVCLAFNRQESPGCSGTVKLATQAGLTVKEWSLRPTRGGKEALYYRTIAA